VRSIKRVLAVTAAATLTGVACLLATAAPASAINPCQSNDPPDYCYDYDPTPPTPAAPTNLTAPSVLQTSVTLQWTDNASNETSYQIRRVVSGTTSYFSAAANSTSFTDTTAPAARYIEYYVSAKNCDSTCSASSAPRVAVQTHQQPANPTGGLSSSSSQGTWGYYSLTGWTIDWDTTAPLQVSLVLDGAVISTQTADRAYSGLNASNPGYGDNHGYYFYTGKSTAKGTHLLCVRATNVGGGVDTNVACWSYVVNGPPSAATNLTLTNTGTSMVIGFKDNANDETGYVLQRSTDAQASWLSVGSQYPPISGSGGAGSATDYSSPPAGTCYRILMVNSYGNTPSAAVCS
jgi:titin